MKSVPAGGHEQPAQMRQAHATHHDAPAVTRKPGKFIRRRTGIATAGDGSKASNFKYNTVRVRERVPMGAVHRHFFMTGGNYLSALTAENVIFRAGFAVLGVILRADVGTPLFGCFPRRAKHVKKHLHI